MGSTCSTYWGREEKNNASMERIGGKSRRKEATKKIKT
jgi:hypothetical protein